MKRIPLQHRLFLVVAAAVVPLAIMSAIALYANYEQQRRQVERSGLDIARALSTAVEAELRRTISALEVLGQSKDLDRPDIEAFHERARRARASQPYWRAVVLSNADGIPLMNTETSQGESLPGLVEKDSHHLVVATRGPIVGYLAKGPNERYAFPVRVPVVRDGRLQFVLTAVVNPTAIMNAVSRQRVSGDWVVAVADAKGMRVARTRSTEQSLGTPYSPTLVALMDKQGSEGTGVTTSSDGDEVFTAWTRSQDSGWYTAVGLPTAQIAVAGRRSLMTAGGGLLLSIALGAVAALVMARRITDPIARLREAAVARMRGEAFVAPQTDVQEIHDVAVALAEASETREAALRGEQAARAAAEAANRAKDEFLAMLGHELRNPLGAISNAATLLQNDKLPPEAAAKTRGVITRQVGQLARLTDDLLDAGRALMGKTILRPVPLDLASVAAQSLATLRSSNRLDRHRIVEEFQTVWVDADPVRMEQIISNLVVNAVKYTPPEGLIRVRVVREGRDAVLRVIDTGVGLTQELASRVFDLFVQGERDLDRSEGGLGIGLTLVRRLAEMHGGTASVRSDGPGQGSEFVVRLPAIEPVAPAKPKSPRPHQEVSARSILLVEDNVDALETMRVLLEMSGHRVETAGDGAVGLEKCLAIQPEVALIDVGLPEIDGYEFARRVRAAPGIRRPFLVAVTGYGSPEDRQRALEAGFDAHLTKPVDPQTLLTLIGSAENLQEARESRPSNP